MKKRQTGHRMRRNAITVIAAAVALAVAGGYLAFPFLRHSVLLQRWSAPPEPTPTSRQYRVVGFGDSVPAGSGCGCTPYVVQVGQQAASRLGRVPVVTNMAQSGLTTAGLTTQLRQPAVQVEVARADLILVTIGANDFGQDLLAAPGCSPAAVVACFQSSLDAQRSQLSAMLDQINTLRTHAGGRVLVTGYWNVFLDGEVGRQRGAGYVAASEALTLADNSLIASVAAAHNDTYIDIYTPFKGDDGSDDDTSLLAADGDHPNAAGHALIARTLLDALG